MARKPSVILTPTEKKEALKVAKGEVKTLQQELARLNKIRKEHEKGIKLLDKDIGKLQQTITKAELAVLTTAPPKAVPTPTA